ncbi:oxidoreductase [Salmonella enterica subsp. arizonae]|uniref:Oxidoreductase n=1 Tax=Salmonella enterica subsp. arizonae TaxID=59203 RepID=A0A379TDY1_SALER|nr:oxidoreductase [Salmonella enterica subsp. arizonae]
MEWRQYPVTLVAENHATEGFVAGRLTTELLQRVPDFGFTHHHDMRPGALYGFRRTASESAWRNALL